MYSVNGIVRNVLARDSSFELVLSDNMPEIYHDADYMNVGRALQELNYEIIGHVNGCSRKRVKTWSQGNAQFIEFAWNGEPNSENGIQKANMGYRKGAELDEPPTISGTRIAAYHLAQLGGTVRLEEFDEPPYTMRNIIELPVNFRE